MLGLAEQDRQGNSFDLVLHRLGSEKDRGAMDHSEASGQNHQTDGGGGGGAGAQ